MHAASSLTATLHVGPDLRVDFGASGVDDDGHAVESDEPALVDGAAGDRVLVAAPKLASSHQTCTRTLLPLNTANDGEARAALADRDVKARDVDANERLDKRRDDGVVRVLDRLAALGRARGRAAGAAVRRGRGGGEGGEAGDGEGEDLGEHGDCGSAEVEAGK
jgi:hypothetical protein